MKDSVLGQLRAEVNSTSEGRLQLGAEEARIALICKINELVHTDLKYNQEITLDDVLKIVVENDLEIIIGEKKNDNSNV